MCIKKLKHLKKNKKGFTLVEIIVVFAVLTVIFTIASFSIFQYLNKGQDTAYRIAENSFQDATSAAFTDCLTGTSNEFCSKYNLPQNKYDYQLVYLDELVENEYIDPIKNPDDNSEYCDMEKSYVYITNRADMSTSKNYDLQYKVCLICGENESEYCRENIDIEGDFASLCYIYYDEEATVPYDGKWTDKNLYLKFTSEGNFKLGISHYEYQPKGDSRWTSIDTPQNIDTITVQLKNTVANKTYQVRGYDDFKRVGTIGECLMYDSATSMGKATSVKIDKATVVSVSITAKKETAKTTVSSGTWSNENVVLTAVGNPASVASGYTYQWYKDGLAISGATSKNYTATENGLYKVKITNGVGNQSVTSSEYEAKVDTKKPETPTITANDGKASDTWHTVDTTLTFSGSSSISGITYYYGTSSTNIKTQGTEISRTTNTAGITYYVKACNGAGTCSDIREYILKVDKSTPAKPTITATDGKASGAWHTANVTLNFSGASSTSNITYYYGTSESNMTSTGSSVTYSNNTTGVTYYVKACNGAGTCGETNSYQIKLDKATTSTLGTPTITASDGVTSGSWHTENFTITPSGISSTSGITYYYGTSSSDVNTKYTSPISISTNTTSQIYYFKACNGAGICSGVSSYTAKLDKSTMSTKPTITASDSKASDTWHTANFTLTPSGVSSTSGVTYYYGTTSGSLTTKYTSAVSISTNTEATTYYFKACNGAGTCSGESSYIARLDKASPSCTITASDGITSGNWHTAAFSLSLSGSTTTSGTTCYYGTSSSNQPNTGNSISASTNTASTTYYVKACNGAGTCSSVSSYTVKLDTSSPSCTISASDSIGSGSWHTSNFTLSLSGSTTTSGTTCYYGTSSNPTTKYSSAISVSSETSSTPYYYKACNGAGTCSSVSSYTAKLDKTKPTVSYSVAGGSYTTTKSVNITASDTNFSSMYVETYKNGTLQSGKSVSGSTSSTYTVALDSEGSWIIYTKVYDAAGNVQSTTPQNSNSFYYQSYTITLCAYTAGQTWTYSYTGGIQSFSVPCNGTYKLEVWGGQGGDSSPLAGGKGGYSSGTISLTTNSMLYVGVGEAGADYDGTSYKTAYNGGGGGGEQNGGGGGATHIAKTNNRGVLANYASYKSEVLIVAGGGGGSDYEDWDLGRDGYGGTGGGTNGGAGQSADGRQGTGGTQSAGGYCLEDTSDTQRSGGFGYGGGFTSSYGGGGGGGGWYGGGAGGWNNGTSGGGGGSGYIGGVSNASTSNGQRTGEGYARITLQTISN